MPHDPFLPMDPSGGFWAVVAALIGYSVLWSGAALVCELVNDAPMNYLLAQAQEAIRVNASTVNLLLGGIIGLQVWIVQRLFSLEGKLRVIASHCKRCKESDEKDTL